MKMFINLLLSFCILFLSSCQNAEEKPVIQQLTTSDITNLLGVDKLYETIIQDIEKVRNSINEDIVFRSKIDKLTYKEYYDFYKTINSEEFKTKVNQKAFEAGIHIKDSIINLYKDRIDAEYIKLRDEYEKKNPTNYFKAEFYQIHKTYRNGSRVGDVYFDFKITPLNGSIQGGVFTYTLKNRATNRIISTESEIASGTCSFSQTVSSSEILRWKASNVIRYNVDNLNFNNISNSEFIQKFSFDIDIQNAIVNNNEINTYQSWSIFYNVPNVYYDVISNNKEMSSNDYVSIINEEYENFPDDETLFGLAELVADLSAKKKLNNKAYILNQKIQDNSNR